MTILLWQPHPEAVNEGLDIAGATHLLAHLDVLRVVSLDVALLSRVHAVEIIEIQFSLDVLPLDGLDELWNACKRPS